MNENYRISRTTAIWLIKVCTKLVRDATNSAWTPMQTGITSFNPGGFAFLYRNPENPAYGQWIDAMVSIVRLLASCLAFQTEAPKMHELLDSLSTEDNSPNDVLDLSAFSNYLND